MPKVHTQKARKDYPQYGIAKGDVYYWWKFRYSGRCVSKTYPKQSQLTQSEYLQRVYELQDNASSQLSDASSLDDLQNVVESIASDIRELAQEQEDKLSNMPDQLQSSSSGELLQERCDSCNDVADNLESMDFSKEDDEEEDVAVDRLSSEARDFIDELS
jgi:hypothetical protein